MSCFFFLFQLFAQKTLKGIFQPAFGVRSTQMQVKLYNSSDKMSKIKNDPKFVLFLNLNIVC